MTRSDLAPDVLEEFTRLQALASSKVQSAVTRGLLPRVRRSGDAAPIPCVDCGLKAQHYDHRDYLEPLVVEPVCGSCNHRRGFASDTFSKHPEYWADLGRQPHRRKGGRLAAGKRLKLRPMRLDEDVWRALQAMKGKYKTINEGIAAAHAGLRMLEATPDEQKGSGTR